QSKISGVPFRKRYITDSTSKYGLVVEITGNTSWQFGASISRRSGSIMQTARSGWLLQFADRTNRYILGLKPRLDDG
ncbi:MAG TPA: hypothetical protein VNO74_06800, partial [Methylomirabilota bacterium]|nr:hypothetical protein [Methylomirabilota bacterium]